ncbi:TIGR03643 family protein [Flavobacterium agricola]|uniref:TIGR03643 family protein n=1 Tax=Flavobacterium agricola TaxID=2870839 RepID=A0ABY6LZC7_9FLAO|nr:TIGR03643 family protein [Flavobacterium agricola]UYW01589.1 TIGR03643 family protein [Flavobacterium agricola]
MEKAKISDFDAKTLATIAEIANKHKKPFDVLKRDYGLHESEVTSLMKMKLNSEDFEAWKKRTAAAKQKLKPLKFNDLEDDDLDSKYYFKNKFD